MTHVPTTLGDLLLGTLIGAVILAATALDWTLLH
jgi:gas vesicle protein